MKEHAPIDVVQYSQSKYRVENIVTGKVYVASTTRHEAEELCALLITAWGDGAVHAFDGGFDQGAGRVASACERLCKGDVTVDQIMRELERGESDAARPPSGQREFAERTEKYRKKLERGGGFS